VIEQKTRSKPSAAQTGFQDFVVNRFNAEGFSVQIYF
jgi:hypothetical protein